MENKSKNNKTILVLGGITVIALVLIIVGIGVVSIVNNRRNSEDQRQVEMNNSRRNAENDTSESDSNSSAAKSDDIDEALDELNQGLKATEGADDFKNFSDSELGI